jgi:hypothetical protein
MSGHAEIARIILEFLKVLITWPVAVVVLALLFRHEIRSLVRRVKKANLPGGISVVLSELAKGAKPKPSDIQSSTVESSPLELSVSPGAYSKDFRAVFVVVGLTNRGTAPDQITSWKLCFPSLNLSLEPTSAPPNLIPEIPMWSNPLIRIQPTEFIQGTLFFRGAGILSNELPEEPLSGRLVATTVKRLELSVDIQLYRMSTLQQNPRLAS